MMLGIYEKAFPKESDWDSRSRIARSIGFDFIELSIDESNERLARLDWDMQTCRDFLQLTRSHGISVPTMCLSGLRRFPLGASDPAVRGQGVAILKKAIQLASRLEVSVVQVAGYDVYGEPRYGGSMDWFIQNLGKALRDAERADVILAIENMETLATDSLSKVMQCVDHFDSPFLKVYVDAGNLLAMGHDLVEQLQIAKGHIAAFHVKDVLPRVCRNIPFGEGIVDFRQLFAEMKYIEFSGKILLEIWADASLDPLQEMSRAYQFILENMDAAGYNRRV